MKNQLGRMGKGIGRPDGKSGISVEVRAIDEADLQKEEKFLEFIAASAKTELAEKIRPALIHAMSLSDPKKMKDAIQAVLDSLPADDSEGVAAEVSNLIEKCQCISIDPPEGDFKQGVEIVDAILMQTKDDTGDYPYEYNPNGLTGIINIYPYRFSQGEPTEPLLVAAPVIQLLIKKLVEAGCKIDLIEKV